MPPQLTARNQPAEAAPIVGTSAILARLHGIGEWAEEGGVANGGSFPRRYPLRRGGEKVKTVLETLWASPPRRALEREIHAARIPLTIPPDRQPGQGPRTPLVRCGTGRISFALEYDLALFHPLLGQTAGWA
jgi:hypothetical protein